MKAWGKGVSDFRKEGPNLGVDLDTGSSLIYLDYNK
jgi:hypothetical protein